jgi:hypothetical protein
MSREKRDRLERLQNELTALERELVEVEALLADAKQRAPVVVARRRTATDAYRRVRTENERLLLTVEYRKNPIGERIASFVSDYDPATAPWHRGLIGAVVLAAAYYLLTLLGLL